MPKKILIVLTLPLLSVLAISVTTRLPASPEPREGGWSVVSSQAASQTARSPQRAGSAVATAPDTGTLQKVIVENGSVTLNLDLNQLNGISHGTQNLQQVHFAVAANSFFPILIFNDLFRGIEPGSMTLIPTGSISVEAALNAFGAAGTSVSQPIRHQPDQSRSARRCNRYSYPRILVENPHRRSCRPCQMEQAQTRRRWCRDQLSTLGIWRR